LLSRSLIGDPSPATAALAPPLVRDALCVSQSGPPLLDFGHDGREALFGALDDLGWRLLRTDFTWSTIEPRPGERDDAEYDDLVTQARGHDLRLLGILDYGNPWATHVATGGDDHFPPDDPASFARFAAATASRYRGRVAAWEIWNEPNNGLSGFWKPAPDPAAYARLATTAAPAIRAADPAARIVTGGLAPTLDLISYGEDWGFLRRAEAAAPGLLARFDAAAIHPYSFLQAPPPEVDSGPLGPSVPAQIEHARALLASEVMRPVPRLPVIDAGARSDDGGPADLIRLRGHSATPLPLWVTEIGWHTAPDSGTPGFPPGVSELDQARFLVRATALALAEEAQVVCWYTLTDYAGAEHNKEAAFGLLRYQPAPRRGNLDPKPSYVAARSFAQVLGDTRFSRDVASALRLPAGTHALRFRAEDRSRSVLVLWSTIDGVVLRGRLDAAITGVELVTVDGAATDLGRPAEVTVMLSASPVYLVLATAS